MRHLNSGSKLGKQPDHRRAVLRSLVTNLLEHGRITTTLTRAKAARPVAEKMITLGKRDTLQSRRQAASYIMLPAVTQKLFRDRKSTRLNSSHRCISYAVFCLKKKKSHVARSSVEPDVLFSVIN